MDRIRKTIPFLVLLTALTLGAIKGYTDDCGSIYGNGYEAGCNWGSNCFSAFGTDYAFCAYAICGHSLNCAPPWLFENSECLVFGCWNIFYNGCNYCLNGGR